MVFSWRLLWESQSLLRECRTFRTVSGTDSLKCQPSSGIALTEKSSFTKNMPPTQDNLGPFFQIRTAVKGQLSLRVPCRDARVPCRVH